MIPRCSRSRVKMSLKKHLNPSRMKYSKAKLDLLLWLDYMMFLRRLATQAHMAALDNKEKVLSPAHIRSVSKKVLKSCHG